MKTEPSKTRSCGEGKNPANDSTRRDSRREPTPVIPPSPEVKIAPGWAWHYRKLIALRQHLLQETRERRSYAGEPIEPHSTHVADSATDEFEHDVTLALLAREENALREVQDAIARIVDGRYGVCEATGAKIPATRLCALPWCRYTLEAERARERETGSGRVRVPDVISLRGAKRDIPGTGTTTRENCEGPGKEGEPGVSAADSPSRSLAGDDEPGAAPEPDE